MSLIGYNTRATHGLILGQRDNFLILLACTPLKYAISQDGVLG